jgi:hypothetical protein
VLRCGGLFQAFGRGREVVGGGRFRHLGSRYIRGSISASRSGSGSV